MSETKRKCWVTDFDGTITVIDFYEAVAKQVVGEEALRFWDAWINGTITHFQALEEILKRIHIPEEELIELINRIEIRPHFLRAYTYAVENNWEVHVVSAGCDYYITRIFERIGITPTALITNHSRYAPEEGLIITEPKESPWHSDFYGVDKTRYVEGLKSEGALIVYSGDGLPDLEAVKRVDHRFAAGVLLEKCREAGIEAVALESFAVVEERLRAIDAGAL